MEAKEQNSRDKQKSPVRTRGRIFQGLVTKKFPTRIAIEFERTVYVHKYERYYKKKTRIHARLPSTLSVEIGDIVQVEECRPLSKLIHFITTKKIEPAEKQGELK